MMNIITFLLTIYGFLAGIKEEGKDIGKLLTYGFLVAFVHILVAIISIFGAAAYGASLGASAGVVLFLGIIAILLYVLKKENAVMAILAALAIMILGVFMAPSVAQGIMAFLGIGATLDTTVILEILLADIVALLVGYGVGALFKGLEEFKF